MAGVHSPEIGTSSEQLFMKKMDTDLVYVAVLHIPAVLRELGGPKTMFCGEQAISFHSHHVSPVQWTTHLLLVTRDPGSNPQGGNYVKPGFSY